MKKDSWFLTTMILGVIAGSFMLQGCNDDTKRPIPQVEEGEPLVVTENLTMECDVPFAFKVIGLDGGTQVGVREGEGTAIVLVTEDGETIEGKSNVTVYSNEWGVDVAYTITTPCPVVDENASTNTVVHPVDGECPTGYTLDNCNANVCKPIVCEDGTALNEETNACEIVCDEGFALDENGTCVDGRLTCGEDTVFDEELNQCVLPTDDCGEGTVMDPETNTCTPVPEIECVEGTVNVDEVCLPLVYPNEDGDCADGYIEGPRGRMCFLESELDIPTPR